MMCASRPHLLHCKAMQYERLIEFRTGLVRQAPCLFRIYGLGSTCRACVSLCICVCILAALSPCMGLVRLYVMHNTQNKVCYFYVTLWLEHPTLQGSFENDRIVEFCDWCLLKFGTWYCCNISFYPFFYFSVQPCRGRSRANRFGIYVWDTVDGCLRIRLSLAHLPALSLCGGKHSCPAERSS
jgi:hypothetical protein